MRSWVLHLFLIVSFSKTALPLPGLTVTVERVTAENSPYSSTIGDINVGLALVTSLHTHIPSQAPVLKARSLDDNALMFNFSVVHCDELNTPIVSSTDCSETHCGFPVDSPTFITFNDSLASLTLHMHNLYFRQRTFSCLATLLGPINISHPQLCAAQMDPHDNVVSTSCHQTSLPITFTFERDYFDSIDTRTRRTIASCTVDEVLNATTCVPVDCSVKYWGLKNFFNTTMGLCTGYNTCSTGYVLNVNTNTCQSLTISVPTVPDINLPVTSVTTQLSSPNTGCPCNHGTPSPNETCFCICDPGWTTDSGQNPQQWVWCNRSIDSYYTPTNPNGTASVSAAGVTVLVLFVLGVVLLVGGCCYCFRNKLRWCGRTAMKLLPLKRQAYTTTSKTTFSAPRIGGLSSASSVGAQRRVVESVVAGDIGLNGAGGMSGSTSVTVGVRASSQIYSVCAPRAVPPPPPLRHDATATTISSAASTRDGYNMLVPRPAPCGNDYALGACDDTAECLATTAARGLENVYQGDISLDVINCSGEKSFVEYVTEENEVHYDNPKPSRATENEGSRRPQPSDMFEPGSGMFWLMGLTGRRTIASEI